MIVFNKILLGVAFFCSVSSGLHASNVLMDENTVSDEEAWFKSYDQLSAADRHAWIDYFIGSNSGIGYARSSGSNYRNFRDELVKVFVKNENKGVDKPLAEAQIYGDKPNYYLMTEEEYKEFEAKYPVSVKYGYKGVSTTRWKGQTIDVRMQDVESNILPSWSSLARVTTKVQGRAIKTIPPRSSSYKSPQLLQHQISAGVLEVPAYLAEIRKQHKEVEMKGFKSKGACTVDDVREIQWQRTPLVSFTHPAMAKTWAKLDLDSIHEYNLDLNRYVKGRELLVISSRAKSILEKNLSKYGLSDVQVTVVDETFKGAPLDEMSFAVKRLDDVIEDVRSDFWGYEEGLSEYYSYRYAKLDDVRLVGNKKPRAPIDGFFQEIAKQRGVVNCLASIN